MATTPAFVNRNGIPCIESKGVSLTTEAATFSFDPQRIPVGRFAGFIAVKIRPEDTFTAPGTAVPVRFTTTGVPDSTTTLKAFNGADVNTGDWPGTGFYLCFYDPVTGLLHLVNGVV